MDEHIKVKCLECERASYIRGDQAQHVVPDGVAKDEAFTAFCPFCDENKYVVVAG